MKAVSISTLPEQDKPAVTVKFVFNSEIEELENFNQAYRQHYFAGMMECINLAGKIDDVGIDGS